MTIKLYSYSITEHGQQNTEDQFNGLPTYYAQYSQVTCYLQESLKRYNNCRPTRQYELFSLANLTFVVFLLDNYVGLHFVT